MRYQKTFQALLSITVFFALPANPDHKITPSKELHIIFDLGGVVFETDPLKAFWALGPMTLVNCWVRGTLLEDDHLLQKWYLILNKITGTTGNNLNIRDHLGNPVPALMADWLLGNKKPSVIRKQIIYTIKKHPEWFANSAEKALFTNMTRLVFHPKTLAKTRMCLSETVALIKRCKAAGHRVHVCSNFDPKTFYLLAEQFPEVFALFDEIIISGIVNSAKPDPYIFTYFTDHIPKERCVLIDDQPENIKAARQAGINAIWCLKTSQGRPNIPLIERRLKTIEERCLTVSNGK